ncbi:hypothetical protein ACTXG6_19105 [Pseudonocardia sp. Cha107L01]|uniref:hypothetical protein n=1 Tax=Pseudonocardia sp. Cha107L01 TaxID=3457576 RepID=UPI00403E9E3A
MSGQARVRSDDAFSARTDASIFRTAAQRLRSRGNFQDRQLSSATGLLMDALGHALARDAASVPAPVRRAALRLARHIQPGPPPPAAGHAARPHRGNGTNDTAVRGRQIPFVESIRLGRMG